MSNKPPSPTSSTMITYLYVPSALIVVGAVVFKKEWVPLAIAIAVGLSAIPYVSQTFFPAPAAKTALNPEQFQEFKITHKQEISHNTAVYRFGLPARDMILGLPIGQHISLAADLDVKDPKTGETKNKEVVRSYTPVSGDHEPGFFDLLIKSYPQGNISRHIATLKVGDSMKVKGPKGAMVYKPNMCKRIGMIAGGSGITPMYQVARAITRGRSSGDKTQVDLIFANVDEKDILLRDELDEMAENDNKFNVYYVLNNPPQGWSGGQGFVTADMIKEQLPAPASDIKILVCGPPPMVAAMKKATESLGYDKARPVSKLDDQVFCF